MSSGTGVGIIDDFLNVTTQVGTMGLVGYGDSGIKAGVVGKPVVDGTKEITGAKAAETIKVRRDKFILLPTVI